MKINKGVGNSKISISEDFNLKKTLLKVSKRVKNHNQLYGDLWKCERKNEAGKYCSILALDKS